MPRPLVLAIVRHLIHGGNNRAHELVKLRELAPAEFQRMHREACRISAESEARLLKLKHAAKSLKEAIDTESGIANPLKLHAARVQLQELNVQIKKMEK